MSPRTGANLIVARAARYCRRCDALIVLARLDGGSLMPVDVEPDPEGNVAVRVDGVQRIRARVLNAERPVPEGTERLHVPHFATCGELVDAPRADGTTPAYRDRAAAHRAHPIDPTGGLW